MPSPSSLSVHEHCLRAAAFHVDRRGDYVTAELVARSVCTLHGVGSIDALTGPSPVPALELLRHIEGSVSTYVRTFLATHGIATLQDLELEVVGYLRALGTPPLVGGDGAPASTGGFEQFMVGPLARHPVVRAHWRTDTYDPSNALSYAAAALHLVDYAASLSGGVAAGWHAHSHSAASPATSPPKVDAVAFGCYLADACGRSLEAQGVVLVPQALPATLMALRHSIHAVAEREVEAVKRALEQHGRHGHIPKAEYEPATTGALTSQQGQGPSRALPGCPLPRARRLVHLPTY